MRDRQACRRINQRLPRQSWKGIYHTGRALSECVKRLDALEREKYE